MSKRQLDSLPYGVIKLDREGKILTFNKAEREMARLVHRRLVGKNFFQEIAPCSDVQDFHGRFSEFLKSGQKSEEFNFSYRFVNDYVRVRIMFVRESSEAAFVISTKINQK